MSEQFSQPDAVGSDRFKPSEHVGALVLFHVTGAGEFTFNPEDGPKDVVHADVDLIDGPGAPNRLTGVMLAQIFLYQALVKKVGSKVLGRLTKDGRSVKLDNHTEADVSKAEAFLNSPPEASSTESQHKSTSETDLSNLSDEQLAKIKELLG